MHHPPFSPICLPPSTSLPPIKQILSCSEHQISIALRSLQAVYCPFRLPSIISTPVLTRRHIPPANTPIPVDSGYASQDEDEDDDDGEGPAIHADVAASLRADPFERDFAARWLTNLIARIEDLDFDVQTKDRIADDAAFILSSFCEASPDAQGHENAEREDDQDDDESLSRKFIFPTHSDRKITVILNDEPLSGTDHTDVGLQSWGAGVLLSEMICADPARFNLSLTHTSPVHGRKILELGAGTGLISLTIGKLLNDELEMQIDGSTTNVTATDYHPTVLSNCKTNIDKNFPSPMASSSSLPSPRNATIDTLLLDWKFPPLHLVASADLLFASDVVYAPEHASLLLHAATHLLAPEGVFWMLVTVRQNGKFDSLDGAVENVFEKEESTEDRRLVILEKEKVQKKKGVGRGDEVGYVLYKIGWI